MGGGNSQRDSARYRKREYVMPDFLPLRWVFSPLPKFSKGRELPEVRNQNLNHEPNPGAWPLPLGIRGQLRESSLVVHLKWDLPWALNRRVPNRTWKLTLLSSILGSTQKARSRELVSTGRV